MAFGRDMDHGSGRDLAQDLPDDRAIDEIANNEIETRLARRQGPGVGRMCRIAELVEADDPDERVGKQTGAEIGADEAGAAGHKKGTAPRIRHNRSGCGLRRGSRRLSLIETYQRRRSGNRMPY
jgi:hypothetical protein